MTTCWRCGVAFDGSDYLPDAPCPDCQLEFPEEEFRKLSVVADIEAARREELVTKYYHQELPDARIAEMIGTSYATVRRTREKLGLPGHDFSGTKLWTDDTRAKMRQGIQDYWKDPNRKPRKHEKAARTGLLAERKDGKHGWEA